MSSETSDEEWRRKTYEYVRAINDYVDRGQKLGWRDVGPEPADPGRTHLSEAALAAVRAANERGAWAELRRRWPPAHEPLIPLLKTKGQSIPVACILDDGSIVARIGAPYEVGRTIRIVDEAVVEIPHVGFFGRSPDRRLFAVARRHGVQILDGWGGPEVGVCCWPTGLEGVPDGYVVPRLTEPPIATQLIPFPDGKRVLLVSDAGIFVLNGQRARRLVPQEEVLEELFRLWPPDDPLTCSIDMAHAAMSRDGSLVAVGSQDSAHLIFDADCKLVGKVGNRSEYPHYALFGGDDTVIAFNSCHFYNGVTIGVARDLLPGLDTPSYEPDARVVTLQDGARVYAGASRGDELIIGDAYGYVRAFSTAGEYRWQQFVGSTIGAMDLSADHRTLVVSTYAGFISVFQLDAGRQEPHQIGTGGHVETRRWLLWRNEPKPLLW